jgi:hypothetical protein
METLLSRDRLGSLSVARSIILKRNFSIYNILSCGLNATRLG